MKIRVSRVDLADAVLSYQDRGMRVMKEIPGYVGEFPEGLIGRYGMAVGFNKNSQPR